MGFGSTVLYTIIGEYVHTIHICYTGVEWTHPSKAALCTTLIIIFFAIGLMLLSGVAYLIPNWRILLLVLTSPLVLVLGFFYWSVVYQTIILRQVHEGLFAKNNTAITVTSKSYHLNSNLCFNRFLPESARWLITQGRKEEALKELRRAARMNGRMVPEDLLEKVSCITLALNKTLRSLYRF